MKSKTTLALIEQLIMVLVFALAAALCLRLFVAADARSDRRAEIDHAVLAAQTAAEQLKQQHGDADAMGRKVFDSEWNDISEGENAAYYLRVSEETTEYDCLWKANISVCTADGIELFSLPVSGQRSEGGTAHG